MYDIRRISDSPHAIGKTEDHVITTIVDFGQ